MPRQGIRYCTYDPNADIAYFRIRDADIHSTRVYSWGIVDVPRDGGVVGIEVHKASEQLPSWLLGLLPVPDA